MSDRLKTFFWDHPALPEQVRDVCVTLPGYLEAQRDYNAVMEQMAAAAGFELFDRFERSLFRCSEYEVQAYYLFGLGLRQEILQAMAGGAEPGSAPQGASGWPAP